MYFFYSLQRLSIACLQIATYNIIGQNKYGTRERELPVHPDLDFKKSDL